VHVSERLAGATEAEVLPGAVRVDEGGGRGPIITVFVSDPSVEAERIAQALRASDYVVVDVPLSMLVARVAVQCPTIVLIDADSDGALDAIARMRELPEADDIHVLFVSRPGGAIASPEEALASEGSGLFVRPVDIPALVRKVGALAGRPRAPSSPPPHAREVQIVQPSLPPPSMRTLPFVPATPVPPPGGPRLTGRTPSEPPVAGSVTSGRRGTGLAPPPVSTELQQLLADAELRVQVRADAESMVPSPEDEIEAVLPAELLAALDEPLEADEEEDEPAAPVRPSAGADAPRERVSDSVPARTTGTPTTGSGPTPADGRARRSRSERTSSSAQGDARGGTQAEPTGGGISTTGGDRSDRLTPGPPSGGTSPPSAWADDPSAVTGDRKPPDPTPHPSTAVGVLPSILNQGEAMAAVAHAIASRAGGALCFIEGAVERRVVLREGDVVTAASSAEDESLLAFLGAHGELPRETVRRLGAKFPPFGRHGGAALVARGYLGQEQMWPTLRAHAEWVLAHVLQMQSGRLVIEAQPTGRLATEPSVFGGTTGAEVFVELVRRVVSPADAIERLGGPGARLGEGPAAGLMSECALPPADVDRLRASYGSTLSEVLDQSTEGDLATTIYALSRLEVLEVLPSVGHRSSDRDEDASCDALDAEALRERVRARSQLVDDGDYFAVLGVARDATGYEVRRAFLELRRSFEPSRLLTPEVLDLAPDVRKIAMVLEEAYEILKDAARRDRYRRAIEGAPEGD
jgi:hypothetical protein